MSQQKRFCPNCGSTWVEPDTSNRAEVYFSGGNPNKWQCNNCEYTGLMPEGDPKVDLSKEDSENSEEDIKFEPEEEYPRKDIGFGIGYLKYLIFILFPALTLFIAYKLIVT